MTAISPAEINRFKARLLKAGISPKSVHNILGFLGKILNDAIADNYLKHSPMLTVKKPKLWKDKVGRALRPEEIQAILDQCEDGFRLIFMMAVLTGMRRGEIFGLQWKDVDWESNVIHVRRALFWRYGKY